MSEQSISYQISPGTTTENKHFIFKCSIFFFTVGAVDITDVNSLEKSGNSDKLLRRGFKNWEERY